MPEAERAAEAGPPRLTLPVELGHLDAEPLRTARLLVRPLRAADADDVHAYQSRPDVVAYLPWPVRDRAASAEHTTARAARRRLAADGESVALAVVLPGGPTSEPTSGAGGDGRVIGDLTLILVSAAHAQVEVGWVLHPDARGLGYATEAASALLDLAVDLGAHRVTARVDPANTASLALCARLGMRHEGTAREDRWDGTAWRDTAVLAVTAAERHAGSSGHSGSDGNSG